MKLDAGAMAVDIAFMMCEAEDQVDDAKIFIFIFDCASSTVCRCFPLRAAYVL